MMAITYLAAILLILAPLSYCRSHKNIYCVTSTINDSQQCNITQCKSAAVCETLDYFTQNSSKYFEPNTTFLFLPGRHDHSNSVIVNNTINMTFSGLPNSKMSVIINCTKKNVGFLFHKFTGIVFENLGIANCGQIFAPHYSENSDEKITRSAALAFDIGTNLTLNCINVTNPQGQGFYINQVEGNILILSSTFQHAVIRDLSNVASNSMFSANCNFQNPGKAYIHRSHFFNNSNIALNFSSTSQHKCPVDIFASGLLIVLKCTNFAVTLDEVTFDDNKGCQGGNLAIIFFNISKPFTKSLFINNCAFNNGKALIGGGMYVSFVEAVKVAPQMNCSDGGTKPRDILKITNTSFIKNKASTYGAGILLQLKNSLTSCVDSSRISLDNCIFQGNNQTGYGGVAIQSENFRSFQYKKQLLPQFDLLITNSRFFENHVMYYDGSGSGVILVKDNYHVRISDIEIYNNTNCSGLLAIGSNFIFSGETNIHHNNASSGGGILLCSDAIMFLQPNARLLITNNHAVHTGGGICVEERCMISTPVCFFQLDLNATVNLALIDTIHIVIANNRANHAGHQLFGGSVDYCYLIDSPYHNQTANKSLSVYNKIFQISPNSSSDSMISSPERQVCICDGLSSDTINCTRRYVLPSVYPGEMFQVKGVLVGQLNGTLPGTVVATLMNVDGQRLDQSDVVQNINSSSCTSLKYMIMTFKRSNSVTLKLEAKFVGDMSFADRLTIFEPLLVTVPFKECPIGFSHSSQTGKCECLPILHPIVHCEIQNNSLSLTKDNWIGFDRTSKRILYSYGYSFDYCHWSQGMAINITDSDSRNTQCRYNRVGILCGECKEHHSAVLGSSHCRDDCKQHHLLLVLVFGLAGIILVVVLIILNMTVTVGTLNGLMFYANMVQLSNTQYFQNRIPGLTDILKVFIAWINLDLGITTCLYKGMDDYAKAWLQFIFPLYIWLILGLIIYLSRRFSFASTLIGNNGIKVLATLVLLSYSKMLHAAIATAHMKFIHHIQIDGSNDHLHVCWIFDCNVPGFKGKHMPLFIAGFIVGLVLIPFTFVLLFIRHLNKISNWPFFCWVWKLKPLFDAYTGPFTNEARCWTGVLCFVRLVLFITTTFSSSGLVSLTVGFSNIAAICLLFFGWLARTRIYKKKWLHILESSFILNLGVLSMGTLYFHYSGFEKISCALTHISVGVAFIMFIAIVGYHAHIQLSVNVSVCQCSKFIKKMIMRSCTSKEYECDDNDGATSDESIEDLFHNIERRHLLPKLS